MGFLNHLLGGRRRIREELKLDTKKRLELWQTHIANYNKRVELAKKFTPKTVDEALKDLAALDGILKQAKDLISEEIIDTEDEEKTDSEILADLKILTSGNKREVMWKLAQSVATESRKQQYIISLLRKAHDILRIELHAINSMMDKERRPENMRDMLIHLSDLVIRHEGYLYMPFMQESYKTDEYLFKDVDRVVRAVLLEEEIEERILKGEEKFVSDMVRIVGSDYIHPLRQIAVNIYNQLLRQVGAPFHDDGECENGLKRMRELVEDDRFLNDIIITNCSKFSDERIMSIMKAFRKSFKLGHFEDIVDYWA